ncbi:hypothetical protein ACS3QZ_09910 [Shimia sp. W99]
MRDLIRDAQDMAEILRTYPCAKRYSNISHGTLSEVLTAIVTKGEVIGGNSRGKDVQSEEFGRIEVKSRKLGTDGDNPRVSLRDHHLEKCDWFATFRWDENFNLAEAMMLPKKDVRPMFLERRQKSGLAHIAWSSWVSAPNRKNIKKECLEAMK